MKSYLNAKLILFKKILKKNSNIILDEKINEYSIFKNIAKIRKLKIIKIDKIFKKIKDLHLISDSEFKINNLSMAIEAVKLCNLKKEKIYKSLKDNVYSINATRKKLYTFLYANQKQFSE